MLTDQTPKDLVDFAKRISEIANQIRNVAGEVSAEGLPHLKLHMNKPEFWTEKLEEFAAGLPARFKKHKNASKSAKKTHASKK